MQNFQGLIKNKVEFLRETKKNSCEFSIGLGFLAWKFSRNVTYIILPNFCGWSFVLPGISRGTVRRKTKKNLAFFFKIVCQTQPLCMFFFWNSPFWSNWLGPIRNLPRKKHWPYPKIGHLHHFHVLYHYHLF